MASKTVYPSKLRFTIVSLHISAALYFLISALLVFALFSAEASQMWIPGIFALLCTGLGVGIEFVISNLKKGKFWSWVVALIICGIYLPSLFFILGLLGFWGSLNKESRAFFRNKYS